MDINLKDVTVQVTENEARESTTYKAGLLFTSVLEVDDRMLHDEPANVEHVIGSHFHNSILHALYQYLVEHNARDLEIHSHRAEIRGYDIANDQWLNKE